MLYGGYNMNQQEELIGKKFNSLMVMSYHSKIKYDKKYLCQCDCGNLKVVVGHKIKSGHTKSCGCLHFKTMSKLSTVHGYHSHPLYGVWNNMKNRCTNKKLTSYKNYGGRGIFVCESWLNPKTFIEWCLNNGWGEGLEIDRINNDDGYYPENCRFVTPSDNQFNTRRSLNSISRKCREMGVRYSLVKDRLRMGWDLEKALTEPKRNYKK